MKKILAILGFISAGIVSKAQPIIKLLEQSNTGLIVDITIPQADFKPYQTPLGIAYIPSLKGATPWQIAGAPDLQKITLSLQIPAIGSVRIEPLETAYQDVQMAIAPSKGRITRPNTPENVPFVYGAQYNKDAFFPTALSMPSTPYIFRNARGQAVHVAAMQYNAVTNTLRQYTHLKLAIYFDGDNNANILSEQQAKTYSPLFATLQQSHFLNTLPDATPTADYTAISDKGSMLVLAPNKYIKHIKPLVEWKNQKGIATNLVNIDTLTNGVGEEDIRKMVQDYYNLNANTFLLIVGNALDVPTRNLLFTDTALHGPGDNAYGYLAGNDHYPDIIVGRFMARDSNDIKIQVQKTINYEKAPNMQDAWMQSLIGIASNQGPGDDNQYDFEHMRDICDSAINQSSFLKKYELYDGDQQGADSNGNPTGLELVALLNDAGASVINYAGHGDNYSITTTGFNANFHLPQLKNNNGKLPFMLTVGCRPGNFIGGNCLAASGAWATDSAGKGTGFIVSAMSTVDQYWNEPMQAQDEINAIIRGARPNNIKYTIGGICVDGFASMNDQYNIVTDPTGGSDMTDTWQIFGDPSVELLTKNEGALQCNYEPLINIGASTYTVKSSTEGALVTLYYEGKILGSQPIVGGQAVFSIPASTLVLFQNITVTITHHNMTPCHSKVLVVNYPTDINEINRQDFSIYPNPVTNNFTISSMEAITAIQILDVSGRQLMSISATNTRQLVVDMTKYVNGIYIVEIIGVDGKMFKQKLIKQ